MERSIGEILCDLRTQLGFSQKETAAYLKKYGVDISNQAISKWERNMTQPNAAQFLALCRLYRVENAVSTFTGHGRNGLLQGLNDVGCRKVKEYIQDLKAAGLYCLPGESEEKKLRRLPLYRLAASAGTGQFLDGDEYDMVEVGEEVPKSAAFGVRLAGDSMEPRFVNGQIVWVNEKQKVRPGDIGLFFYDGNAYCKKLTVEGERLYLTSLNKKYAPIPVSEEAELRVFGRVVG